MSFNIDVLERDAGSAVVKGAPSEFAELPKAWQPFSKMTMTGRILAIDVDCAASSGAIA